MIRDTMAVSKSCYQLCCPQEGSHTSFTSSFLHLLFLVFALMLASPLHPLGGTVGSLEPEKKGFVARAKGLLLKGVGALVLTFVAYHMARSAFRTIAFWMVTPVLGVAAFKTWRFFKQAGKKER